MGRPKFIQERHLDDARSILTSLGGEIFGYVDAAGKSFVALPVDGDGILLRSSVHRDRQDARMAVVDMHLEAISEPTTAQV